MGFTSLWATNRCGHVGTPVVNSTIAFDATELSSIPPRITRAPCTVTTYFQFSSSGSNSEDGEWHAEGYDYVFTEVDDIYIPNPVPIEYAHLAQDCSTIDGYSYFPNNPDNAQGEYGKFPTFHICLRLLPSISLVRILILQRAF